MSTRITTEGSTLPASSQTPSVRTFQIDPAGLGDITESVNLFRGDVTVPLTLATISSRSGLEASATLLATTPDLDEVDLMRAAHPRPQTLRLAEAVPAPFDGEEVLGRGADQRRLRGPQMQVVRMVEAG